MLKPSKVLSQVLKAPLTLSAFHLSQILLYSAESIPLVFARRTLGLGGKPNPEPPADHRQRLKNEVYEMLREDYKNMDQNIYTVDLLSSLAPVEHAKRYVHIFKDSLLSGFRAKKKKYKEFSAEAQPHLEGLPEYYKRNFHFQTDGYLSRESAELYDHQTEILFKGTLSLMRRLLLADLIAIAKKQVDTFSVLEIGAGAGETTGILSRSIPNIKIDAIDLSAPYLEKAREKFSNFSNITFIKSDGTTYSSPKKYDAVVSAYCLHEMPIEFRKQLVNVASNHLKKDGLLLLIDSLQLGDRPEFDWALKQFPKDFHEPFYANYVRTPLQSLLTDDFSLVEVKTRFLSKSMLARKK